MAAKLKLNEVAKDFNLTSKEVVALLSAFSPDTQYKTQSALSADEVGYVFDALTQKNSVKNFDTYFAMGEDHAKKHKEAKQSKQEELLRQQEMIAKMFADDK